MECNIYGVKIKSDGPVERGAGSGIYVSVGGINGVCMGGNGAVEEEGDGASMVLKWKGP